MDEFGRGRVLAVGSHPDDIELGCGGTLSKLVSQGWSVYTVVCSGGGIKAPKKLRLDEYNRAGKLLGVTKAFALDYEDGKIGHEFTLVRRLEEIINEVAPSVIYSQSYSDHHQDHINVSHSTISACRRRPVNLVLYPNLSSMVQPEFNFFVDISDFMQAKLNLLASYCSQSKNWYMDPSFVERCAMCAGDMIGKKYAEKFLIYSCFD